MEKLKQYLSDQDLPYRAQACYQCGTCAAGCPVTKWRWDFNPRLLIERLLRRETRELVQDKRIWLCAACLTCLERCPQRIHVSEIIVHLKNAAARMGNIPENELKKDREIMRSGWSQNPGGRITRIRQELGLPDLPRGISPSELQEIARHVGWSERIGPSSGSATPTGGVTHDGSSSPPDQRKGDA